MNDKNEIIETEIKEKETVEGEVVDEVFEETDQTSFDPNIILNTIMQSQDPELRNILSKLSITSAITKVTVVFILIGFFLTNFFNYLGVATLVYGLYCAIYVLVNYKKIKEHESSIKDIFSKDGAPVDLKKTVLKSLMILLICIPLVALSIWYWTVFTKQ